MTHQDNQSRESPRELKSITVRIPHREYMLLREYAGDRSLSMNSVISEAVVEYGARIGRRQARDRIQALQHRLRARSKPGSDSVELLREMREERSESKSGPRKGGQR